MVTRPTETVDTQSPGTGNDHSRQIVVSHYAQSMNTQSPQTIDTHGLQNADTESPKSKETLSVQDTHPQSIHKEAPSAQTMDPESIHIYYYESMDPSSPTSINIHYPQSSNTQPRPIINLHYAHDMTMHTHCPTCGSQMQDDDEDGGNESMDGVNGSAYGDSSTARVDYHPLTCCQDGNTDGNISEYHHPWTGFHVLILILIILLVLPFIMALALSYIEFILLPINGHVESLLHSESALRELLQDL